ncbi:recombinase family protein [Planctobacterium marinum]|uniref:recombinase family protein n=1 Tax=Planctobacterium marinum TaxID=1631968 RepID=UPI001E61D887|nr:recombinase family protein [Planctobacterium marinum]
MSDSERRQLKEFDKFCNNHPEYQKAEHAVYSDLGISAYNGDEREALKSLLEAVRLRKIIPGSIICFEHFDRLSRQGFKATYDLITEILEQGVNLAFLKTGDILEQKHADDVFSVTKIAMYAHEAFESSRLKGERVSEKWKQKQQQAADFNKVMTTKIPAWLYVETHSKDNRELVVDFRKAQTVRRIFELSKIHGNPTTARILNEEGIQPISEFNKSGLWHPSGIKNITRNPAVHGELQLYRSKKGREAESQILPNYYPEIISKKEFNLLQRTLDKRGKHLIGRTTDIFANLLQGLVFCGECNGKMNLTCKNKGGNDKYLRCIAAKSGSGCSNNRLYRYDLIEKAMLDVTQYSFKSVLASNQQAIRDVEENIIAIEQELDSLKNRETKLTASLGFLEDDTQLIKQINNVQTQIKTSKRQLKLAREQLKPEAVIGEQELAQLLTDLKRSGQDRQRVNQFLRATYKLVCSAGANDVLSVEVNNVPPQAEPTKAFSLKAKPQAGGTLFILERGKLSAFTYELTHQKLKVEPLYDNETMSFIEEVEVEDFALQPYMEYRLKKGAVIQSPMKRFDITKPDTVTLPDGTRVKVLKVIED